MYREKIISFVKIAPNAPEKIPNKIMQKKICGSKIFSRFVEMFNISQKSGRTPKKISTTAEAETDAVKVADKISGENFLCNSSAQKITPASGALKIAASPAPAPAVNKIFPSNSP